MHTLELVELGRLHVTCTASVMPASTRAPLPLVPGGAAVLGPPPPPPPPPAQQLDTRAGGWARKLLRPTSPWKRVHRQRQSAASSLPTPPPIPDHKLLARTASWRAERVPWGCLAPAPPACCWQWIFSRQQLLPLLPLPRLLPPLLPSRLSARLPPPPCCACWRPAPPACRRRRPPAAAPPGRPSRGAALGAQMWGSPARRCPPWHASARSCTCNHPPGNLVRC